MLAVKWIRVKWITNHAVFSLSYTCPPKFTLVEHLSFPTMSGYSHRLQTSVNDQPVRENLFDLISCFYWVRDHRNVNSTVYRFHRLLLLLYCDLTAFPFSIVIETTGRKNRDRSVCVGVSCVVLLFSLVPCIMVDMKLVNCRSGDWRGSWAGTDGFLWSVILSHLTVLYESSAFWNDWL